MISTTIFDSFWQTTFTEMALLKPFFLEEKDDVLLRQNHSTTKFEQSSVPEKIGSRLLYVTSHSKIATSMKFTLDAGFKCYSDP